MKTRICGGRYGVLSLLLLLASATFAQGNVALIVANFWNPTSRKVLVAAHRANWDAAPENSLPAIQSCIDNGVDIVEIDNKMTKDGHLIIMHDQTIDRTTNGKGKVADYSLAEIKKFRL